MRFADENVKQQAANGLRLGLGAGAFLIAGGILSIAVPRLMPSTSSELVRWSDWTAWVEAALASVLLASSAGVWVNLVSALALFGILKSLLMLLVGEEPYHHHAIPRFESFEAALFCFATVLLTFRFFKEVRPSLLDRIALTLYVLSADCYFHWPSSTVINPWAHGRT